MVSVIIVNYNGREYLKDCLSSVLGQSYKDFEVLLVDNCSTDGSTDYVRKNFPQVKVFKNPDNMGYGGGNNIGFKNARGDCIAVLNPDTIVDREWLKELVNAIQRRLDAKMVTSKVLLHQDSKRINACGNDIHFTGLVFSRGLSERENYYAKEEYVVAPSGCSFLVPRELIEEIDFFDTEFSNHWLFEDTDLAIRLQVRGYKCLFVPSSKVYHKFTLKMDMQRYFMLERGRYLLLFKNFSRRTLIFLLPSLILTEVLTWGYALYKGKEYIVSKAMAYKWILKNFHRIFKKQAKFKKLRRLSDKEILEYMTWKISIPQQFLTNRSFKMIAESFFNVFYFILYRLTLSIAG
jgi:GT2 family glycosyltransferase